ncbi:ABC transporter ATP-binding protein [Xanthobacter dioxanivorans]|uniref:ABC transporter ATP-binding protein n=1 Tax=Xanthobacter dioxanivorans TaxID=2528964 RepID=A0A974SL63_9HYPH|nr:ABC transporter ATP-binding protein [Xanthobacter dioxanivorans]QRG08979.1 ABC transporter ATP-binding protein [Xanthobacter dioxanivorans]
MLEVRSLTTTYQGLTAISDISIDVREAEIILVAGANGAGKSTLLKSITGMERAQAGTVSFLGTRIERMPPHRITAAGIAFVPENRRLFPRLSVQDTLRLGSYLHRRDPQRDAPLNLVFDIFPRLAERLDQRAETLSGGEQQMLAIGRALMTRPRLLLLDEPSQGIMPKLVNEILFAVEKICAEGVSIILVEQRIKQSIKISDRYYLLKNGKIISSGPSNAIGGATDLESVYLS